MDIAAESYLIDGVVLESRPTAGCRLLLRLTQ